VSKTRSKELVTKMAPYPVKSLTLVRRKGVHAVRLPGNRTGETPVLPARTEPKGSVGILPAPRCALIHSCRT
jgi:hypothetical protein